jgi:RNA 3'-terminal phosphate cyclase (ATP)
VSGAALAPVDIDGSRGEGGGQILRTSLALAMITGRPFVMRNIRAGRAKPGLRRQHLACVEAAASLCKATVHGAKVGAKYLEFAPGPIVGGELVVDIGTAGSTTLVVQTVLVPAIAAGQPLKLVVRGGTHNPMAPPFEFVDRVFLPHLRSMGAAVTITLDHHGFAPGSDGRNLRDAHDAPLPERGQLTVTVGAGALRPLALVEAGPVVARHATAMLCRLPTHVAERELAVVRERLGLQRSECEVRDVRGHGPANVLMIELERRGSRELVTSFGERGLRAETVAARACDEIDAFLAAGVPVGEHLADQLLLPMAVAGGGRFRCAPLSTHATTNIATIAQFLEVPIRVDADGAAILVTVGRDDHL